MINWRDEGLVLMGLIIGHLITRLWMIMHYDGGD